MATPTAIIIVRRHLSGVGPATAVAGLPLLTRLLHSLADAGVRQVSVYGDLTPEEADAVLDEAVGVRLQTVLARARPGETELLALRRLVAAASGPVLFVPGDIYADSRAFRQLLDASRAGETVLAVNDEGYTGVATLPFDAVPEIGGTLEFIDDLAALAERGEAHIVRMRELVVRLWDDDSIRDVERILFDRALSVPGEPALWTQLVLPFRRALVPAALQRRVSPNGLIASSTVAALLGAAAFAVGQGLLATVAAAVFAAASLVAAVELPLDRALRARRHPASLDPYVRHALVTVAFLVAMGVRAFRAGEPPWVVSLAGGASFAAVTAALIVQFRIFLMRDHGQIVGRALMSLPPSWHGLWQMRWLSWPPFPALALAGLALVAAWAAAFAMASILAGAALLASLLDAFDAIGAATDWDRLAEREGADDFSDLDFSDLDVDDVASSELGDDAAGLESELDLGLPGRTVPSVAASIDVDEFAEPLGDAEEALDAEPIGE